jgi:hypothetical protein
MALPNKPKGELKAVPNPEIQEHECDVLIVGGGMAACGAAFEVKKWAPDDMKIIMVDKAALERSGAVAQGLSAINTYIGENPIEDYVKMVRNDLMGVVREDLVYDLGRHVDESVKLFEEWGLPVWKKDDQGNNLDGAKPAPSLREGGQPVRTGKWQIMINGESYKCIVAEPAKKALGEENVIERVFIVKMLLDKNVKPYRRRGRLFRARKQGSCLQVQDRSGCLRRRGKYFPSAFNRRGQGPCMVPGMERRFHLHHVRPGRRYPDHDGKPLHPGPLQRRLRPGWRMVPAVQGQGAERPR